ncbi:MAG: DUF1707 and DUF2154 domain-containing protein [Spirochaetales bacterium]|nr:DUF1707 and DUF2154 domain-containing protein [Spirochaetales bacterium]
MARTPADRGAGSSEARLESLRDRVMETLTGAFSTNGLDMDEYERRAGLAQAAESDAELEALVLDLPADAPSGRAPATRAAAAPGYLRASAPLESGSRSVACVMSDRRMTGDWLHSDKVDTFTLMGSTVLDLREVELPPGPVRIDAFVLMGEAQIIVPPDLPVRMDAFAFMGEAAARRGVSQSVRNARTWVEVGGFVLMGSIEVKAK